MELFEPIVRMLDYLPRIRDFVWGFGIPVGGQEIPLVVLALLGTGVFLTLRLGFVQLRRFAHGVAVTSGRYDDPDEPGDVPHYQALTTALSATVGIGNIAGVALAIHWGGPGALVWMWITALLGMAVKFTEVTLAQEYRQVETADGRAHKWDGTVSGGPMYYIERGLGPGWRWMALFFAVMLGTTAFMTGNAVQANTVADTMQTWFGVPTWVMGLVTASIVALVIVGGITRIGRVTSILAPIMAVIYVLGALTIIALNFDQVIPAFALIFQEAFNPSAGVAGTGVGAFLLTMMWGVNRGLFSNESGQGSAPIAHAAAKTDEPVSEGVVALLEPFIDTILICTMTGLVIVMTGAWNAKLPTEISLASGDISYVHVDETGAGIQGPVPLELRFEDGRAVSTGPRRAALAWHQAPVEPLFVDPDQTVPFTGVIQRQTGTAVATDGTSYTSLYGDAVENGAPLTMLAFGRGLPGNWGGFIVVAGVLLFAISTAISWSYYGDRCANYVFGRKAILPYKIVFIAMHFVGAVVALDQIWALGDVFLGIVILPNLIALWLLSPVVVRLTKSYFERRPWLENAAVHRRVMEERRAQRQLR